MSRGHSESFIGSSVAGLVKAVFEGFRFHPFFYLLELSRDADPPLRPYLHQVDLLARLSLRRPIRALIGDEIGLGKTIEAISVVKFLEEQGEVKRVLLLVPRILVEQWKGELSRLGLRAKQIERESFDNLTWEPGWYIASMDLVKLDRYKKRILEVDWDFVIVDEAHRVGVSAGEGTLRYRLVGELTSKRDRNVLFLTATPHRGHAEDYIERLRLIDPDLSADASELDTENFYLLTRYSVVFRRSKGDVNKLEETEVFKKCRFFASVVGASDEEKEFNEKLYKFLRDKLAQYYSMAREKPRAIPLLLALIAKRASSSPRAAIATFSKIILKRSMLLSEGRISEDKLNKEAQRIISSFLGDGYEEYEEGSEPDKAYEEFIEKSSYLLSEDDKRIVGELLELAKKIESEGDSRLKLLLMELEEKKNDRVVIFTEFRDTAQYIYEALKRHYKEKELALVTSEKILSCGKEVKSIEDVKRDLKQGKIRVIVSTDVASEGLNLQVANVIIHYEPVWSPVKLLQRVGRVWRLGQEKDVESINLLMTTHSDLAVLSKLYSKLTALIVSGIETEHAYIGEELRVTNLKTGERTRIPLGSGESEASPPVVRARDKEEFNEYSALVAYIKGGEKGLEEYVKQVIAAIRSLKKALEKAGLRKMGELEETKKTLSEMLGESARGLVDGLMVSLLERLAESTGCSVRVRTDGKLIVECLGLVHEVDVKEVGNVYSNILAIANKFSKSSGGAPLMFLADKWGNIETLLFIELEFKYKERVVFSEVVGWARLDDSSERVFKGVEVLELLCELIPRIRGIAQGTSIETPLEDVQTRVGQSRVRGLLNRLLREYINYMSKTEERGLATKRVWGPRGVSDLRYDARLIGIVVCLPTAPGSADAVLGPAPEDIRRIEERAMKIVMEFEERSGRRPVDVHAREHYDIYSVDPRTGEERFIEVKGHARGSLYVELTEDEFKFLESKGSKAWLYLVVNMDSKPFIVMVRDPVRSWRWSPRVSKYVSYGGLGEATAG